MCIAVMETFKLLTTLAFVAGLFGASAERIDDIENFKDKLVDLTLQFSNWTKEENAWEGSLTSPHIIGGSEAVPHSHPHQVILFICRENNGTNEFRALCGASILTESWVLTAAHCADSRFLYDDSSENTDKNKLGIIVAAGIHDIEALNLINVQVRRVSDIVVHPEWNPLINGLENDITLLKLGENFVLDEYVKAIRLPKLSQQSESFKGSLVTMTGWGFMRNKEKKTAPIAQTLQAVDSEVISNFYCKLRYLFFLVKDSNICTSSGWSGKGSCNGDSGGPLIIKEADGEPTLIGVTSFNFGCTLWWLRLGLPTGFTRVTSYLNWIQSNTGIEPRT